MGLDDVQGFGLCFRLFRDAFVKKAGGSSTCVAADSVALKPRATTVMTGFDHQSSWRWTGMER